MGGDYAPGEIVRGAAEAAADYPVKVLLVGNENQVGPLLKHHGHSDIEIIPAAETIGPAENPVQSLREKPGSSIVVGTRLIKEGKAQAFASAGNTGAVAAAAIFILGMLAGVKRPALCSNINISGHRFLLLDVGANADCRPFYLAQFGFLGSIMANAIMGINSPRVYLLNNGEEESKGNLLTKEAHHLLVRSNLNFGGNIEGQELFSGKADVVVTDGYTGNIILKVMEGIASLFSGQIDGNRKEAHDDRHESSGHALAETIRKADYREHGGAILLGVNGNIVVSHGRSRAKAVKNAVRLCYEAAVSDLNSKLKSKLDSGLPAPA